MAIVLYLVAVLSLLSGLAAFVGAKSAIHEIIGSVSILTAVVAAGSAATISALKKIERGLMLKDEKSTTGSRADVVPTPEEALHAVRAQGLPTAPGK